MEQFGQNIELINIQVEIEIAESTDDRKRIVENAAADGGFSTITTPPLNFTVRGTYGGITIEVSRFHVYVERMLAIEQWGGCESDYNSSYRRTRWYGSTCTNASGGSR